MQADTGGGSIAGGAGDIASGSDAQAAIPPLDHWVTATIESDHVIAMMSSHNISANLILASGGNHVGNPSAPVEANAGRSPEGSRRAPARPRLANASMDPGIGWEVKIKQPIGKYYSAPEPPQSPPQQPASRGDMNVRIQNRKGAQPTEWSSFVASGVAAEVEGKDSRRMSVSSRKSREGRSAASSFIARLSMDSPRPSAVGGSPPQCGGGDPGKHQGGDARPPLVADTGGQLSSRSCPEVRLGHEGLSAHAISGGRMSSVDAAVTDWMAGVAPSRGGFVSGLPSLPEAARESENGSVAMTSGGAASSLRGAQRRGRGGGDGSSVNNCDSDNRMSDGSIARTISLMQRSHSGFRHMPSTAETTSTVHLISASKARPGQLGAKSGQDVSQGSWPDGRMGTPWSSMQDKAGPLPPPFVEGGLQSAKGTGAAPYPPALSSLPLKLLAKPSDTTPKAGPVSAPTIHRRLVRHDPSTGALVPVPMPMPMPMPQNNPPVGNQPLNQQQATAFFQQYAMTSAHQALCPQSYANLYQPLNLQTFGQTMSSFQPSGQDSWPRTKVLVLSLCGLLLMLNMSVGACCMMMQMVADEIKRAARADF